METLPQEIRDRILSDIIPTKRIIVFASCYKPPRWTWKLLVTKTPSTTNHKGTINEESDLKQLRHLLHTNKLLKRDCTILFFSKNTIRLVFTSFDWTRPVNMSAIQHTQYIRHLEFEPVPCHPSKTNLEWLNILPGLSQFPNLFTLRLFDPSHIPPTKPAYSGNVPPQDAVLMDWLRAAHIRLAEFVYGTMPAFYDGVVFYLEEDFVVTICRSGHRYRPLNQETKVDMVEEYGK